MDELRQREMDEAIREALDDTPRAAELVEHRRVLLERRKMLLRELEEEERAPERANLKKRIAEVEEHIRILTEESIINQFVEDAIGFSHEMRKLQN